MSRPVGIAANPASGKDVRRLVARASVFDNQEKSAIVRRAIVGAMAAGARHFRYVPDSHEIAASALAEFADEIEAEPVDAPDTRSALDTIRGATALAEADCGAVLTLGGDGTNRAFVRGWRDATLVPISTGTNNVFPVFVEATVAGAAAALVATGALDRAQACHPAKAVTVRIEGEDDDVALIDAVATAERFVGARALLEAGMLRLALLTRADPAAVGMTAIGGLIEPLGKDEDGGLLLELDAEAEAVNAPIAPGWYRPVGVKTARRVAFGEVVTVRGPCVLAFDGERERTLLPDQHAELTIARDGPSVVDVARVMALAAEMKLFRVKAASG